MILTIVLQAVIFFCWSLWRLWFVLVGVLARKPIETLESQEFKLLEGIDFGLVPGLSAIGSSWCLHLNLDFPALGFCGRFPEILAYNLREKVSGTSPIQQRAHRGALWRYQCLFFWEGGFGFRRGVALNFLRFSILVWILPSTGFPMAPSSIYR